MRGAVLGSPIEHSLSPILHRAAFEYLGIAGDYSAIEVKSGQLNDFIKVRSQDFEYLSLTMPLKEEVLSLDVVKDSLTERIQSGNTLINRDGTLSLTSTDGSGLVAALKNQGLTRFNSVLVLGAGGTARAVVGALDSLSKEVDVLGRSSLRKSALESAINHANFRYLPWVEEVDFSAYDLVVNTTPAGAADLLIRSVLPAVRATLFDVIYKPWPTELARRWSDCGGNVINGLELLLYQGIDQLEILNGSEIDKSGLAAHIRPLLARASK